MLRLTFRRSSTLPSGRPLTYFLYALNFCVLNSKYWIWCSEFLIHLENLKLYKNCIFAVKEFRTNIFFLLCSISNVHYSSLKKLNSCKLHIIFSFVKWHLSIIQIYTIQIQIVLSYYKLHTNTAVSVNLRHPVPFHQGNLQYTTD